MSDHSKNQHPEIADPTFQDRDIKVGVLIICITLIGAAIAVSFVGMRILFKSQEASFYRNQVLISERATQRQLPPAPMLQVDESGDLVKYKAEQNRLLTTSEILDEQAGIARIPVEQAKAMILKQGLGPVGAAPAAQAPAVEPETPVAEEPAADAAPAEESH